MTNSNRISKSYLSNVRYLLGPHPEALAGFESLWSDGQIRAAYEFADRAMRDRGIILSPEQRAKDEAFYWEFVE